MDQLRVRTGTPEDVVRVEPLFRALTEHHREHAPAHLPVRDGDAAWARRRAQYERWMRDAESTVLLLAHADDDLVGYAMLRFGDGGLSTWDLGDVVGEVETMAVRPEARGLGVGGRLMAAARDHARERGAGALFVGVLATNASARGFYAREGFDDFYLQQVHPL